MNLIKRIVLTAGIALVLTGCISSQNVFSVTSDSTDKQSDREVSKDSPDIYSW
ncbi:MAG: lipoprotein [Erysipelotrichaceae bacterium]|nr:lipoprotein [Erysipelotrichaceae bacterium]